MKLKLFFRIRHFIINSKIWMQRTMTWIAIINTGMILFLVLAKLQDYGVEIHITKFYVPIYLGIFFFAMLLIGYLEDKAGFFKEELRASSGRNPYFNDIIKRLERIEEKIKGKEDK